MNRLSIECGAAAVTDYLRSRGEAVHIGEVRLLDPPNGERLIGEYALDEPGSCASTRSTLVVKSYSDESGAHTFAVMREIHDALSRHAPASTLRVPAALWYDAARRCLVQERVPGASLAQLARSGDHARCLQRAGEALAVLHALPLEARQPKRIEDHLRELIRPDPLVLRAQLPEHATRIEALLRGLHGAQAQWANTEVAPLHRDFHLRQLFADDDGVWLIDWDLFEFGDPALDLGNFLMVLETRLPELGRGASELFLDAYFRTRPAGIVHRIPPFRALNYLRRACKHYRLRGAGWDAQVHQMLSAAEAALAG